MPPAYESPSPCSLTRFMIEEKRAGRVDADLRLLIEVVARACKTIAVAVGKGALGGVLGDASSAASTGRSPILGVAPTQLHQRVPVFLGSQHGVEHAVRQQLAHDETRGVAGA